MEDYEELMLQISDVMREANRVRPELSHEQAIKNIRGIVERHGKWVECNPLVEEKYMLDGNEYFKCSECNCCVRKKYNFCPDCGARMDL